MVSDRIAITKRCLELKKKVEWETHTCIYKRGSRLYCVSDNNIVIPVSGSSSEGKGRNPGLGRGSLFSIIDDEFSRRRAVALKVSGQA